MLINQLGHVYLFVQMQLCLELLLTTIQGYVNRSVVGMHLIIIRIIRQETVWQFALETTLLITILFLRLVCFDVLEIMIPIITGMMEIEHA